MDAIAEKSRAKYKLGSFSRRHIGVSEQERREMLEFLKVTSLEKLISQVVPEKILSKQKLNIPEGQEEHQYLKNLKERLSKNKLFRNYIGLGYYPAITPAVIQRNLFENPSWYTPYTPYQAEISQGRLEALLNFQTVICELTNLPIANASLLDEATSAAEAMSLLFRVRSGTKKDSRHFFISKDCFPQTIAVLRSRAKPLGVQLVISCPNEFSFPDEFFGALLQSPDNEGRLVDFSSWVRAASEKSIRTILACDILSLCLFRSPGEIGFDIAVGSSQRFGVPMGFGGPHAAFFACKEELKRNVPGRIIGISKTVSGEKAYRMALQTREQHIRREKATSNICTAQALLASMASMYVVYHGKEGLIEIAQKIHNNTKNLAKNLEAVGYNILHNDFFDTITILSSSVISSKIKGRAESHNVNLRYHDDSLISISLHEGMERNDLEEIYNIFSETAEENEEAEAIPTEYTWMDFPENQLDTNESLIRRTDFLNQEVFQKYQSETKMMRYLLSLEKKDISLTNSMIPLGSCTMKLNAASEMMPLSWESAANLHPYCPKEQCTGYLDIISELEYFLVAITGFASVSFQPNSGAQGEYAGLMVISAYHQDRGEAHRNIVLIPNSAHGTNPASAVMAGMNVVLVECDSEGNVNFKDLKNKVQKHSQNLAALMVTYPSTHGIFEEEIQKICSLIHEHRGLVYMDGANMNAQVGITNPHFIGADICHLNLHKTFAIPHGGGGPGMGPVAATKTLAPYFPSHPFSSLKVSKQIEAIAASPYSSASILLISHAYISLLGCDGLKEASEYAILNANYIKNRLESYYPVLFSNKKGRVAHELILDLSGFKKSANVDPHDIAKRLMDYGYHSPTMAWPVPNTMMIEPTESESKDELDKFCDSMISIRNEIERIESGIYSREDNPLKNAPHTHQSLISGNWNHIYSREEAAYPLAHLKESKFWPPVSRIDDAYGDRFLICTCF